MAKTELIAKRMTSACIDIPDEYPLISYYRVQFHCASSDELMNIIIDRLSCAFWVRDPQGSLPGDQ